MRLTAAATLCASAVEIKPIMTTYGNGQIHPSRRPPLRRFVKVSHTRLRVSACGRASRLAPESEGLVDGSNQGCRQRTIENRNNRLWLTNGDSHGVAGLLWRRNDYRNGIADGCVLRKDAVYLVQTGISRR